MPERVVFDATLAVVHALAGAAWFGAMAYSFFLLHPRARAYFKADRDFEDFIAAVSHGARWKVLAGLGIIGATGAGLCVTRWPSPRSGYWLVLVGAKVVVLLAALALFIHISWRLWPARVLALDAEVPHFQKVFRRAAAAMITLAALGMALGVLAHSR